MEKTKEKKTVAITTKDVGKYKLKIDHISYGKGYWNYLKVHILDEDGKELGSYDRNYSNLYNTFVPFMKNGKEYALYSRDYTATRVMSLPDCKDIAGEDPNTWGFCPTDFFVPDCKDFFISKEFEGNIGFVAGCVWGDDHSWKIQFLDLSKIEEGILKRDDRFGYIELCPNDNLRDAIKEVEVYFDGDDREINIDIRQMKNYCFYWNEKENGKED
jgi:hypothetical protein